MTDYRAQLQALVAAFDEHGGKWPQENEDALHAAVARARALLDQQEPPELTDEALLESAAKALGYRSIPSDETCLTAEAGELLAFARAAIAADRARR